MAPHSFLLTTIAAMGFALMAASSQAEAAERDSTARTRVPLTQSEMGAFRDKVKKCWKMPPLKDDGISAYIMLRLNRDGTLAGPLEVSGGVMNPKLKAEFDAFIASAKQALVRCQPYTMFDPTNYETWKELEPRFVPSIATAAGSDPKPGAPASTASAGEPPASPKDQKFDADKIEKMLDERLAKSGNTAASQAAGSVGSRTALEKKVENAYHFYIGLQACASAGFYKIGDDLRSLMAQLDSSIKLAGLDPSVLWERSKKSMPDEMELVMALLPAIKYETDPWERRKMSNGCKGYETSLFSFLKPTSEVGKKDF